MLLHTLTLTITYFSLLTVPHIYLHISTIFTHSSTYTYTNATITWKN